MLKFTMYHEFKDQNGVSKFFDGNLKAATFKAMNTMQNPVYVGIKFIY